MTEQEIEQARADVDQLDIEQLRCGVLLQLLHIEALKKERDALALDVDQWEVDYIELRIECDALAAAAKLALEALEMSACYVNVEGSSYESTQIITAITALSHAGVQ
jgi:hypothetical protein